MSVRVENIDNDISSILGRSSRPPTWRWWEPRRARQELAAREATELLNQFGKDAYWLACICARRSPGALGRHWNAVAAEIERRTGRKSPGKTGGRLRAALGRLFVPPDAERLDAYHAGAPEESASAESAAHDDPRGAFERHFQAVAVELAQRKGGKSPGKTAGSLRAALDQLFVPPNADVARLDAYRAGAADESASAARAAHDRGGNSDRGAAMDPHNDEMDDNPPRQDRRRRVVIALALVGCATVGTAGAYAYWTHHAGANAYWTFAPSSTQTSAALSQAEPAQAVRGYVVQVSARRSQADAEASFRSLQSKFPRQLGGRTAIVQRADLGPKGIYYRAMVGPFPSPGEADQFCGSLKAAGGHCIIQRN